MLCRVCNWQIDDCPHVDGCSWADYLNRRPALPLRLLYPDRRNAWRKDRAQIEHLGFDPYLGSLSA